MEHVQKMILIPYDAIERFKNNDLNSGGGSARNIISSLDAGMREILEVNFYDRCKRQRYQQVLQWFLHVTEKAREPVKISVTVAPRLHHHNRRRQMNLQHQRMKKTNGCRPENVQAKYSSSIAFCHLVRRWMREYAWETEKKYQTLISSIS